MIPLLILMVCIVIYMLVNDRIKENKESKEDEQRKGTKGTD